MLCPTKRVAAGAANSAALAVEERVCVSRYTTCRKKDGGKCQKPTVIKHISTPSHRRATPGFFSFNTHTHTCIFFSLSSLSLLSIHLDLDRYLLSFTLTHKCTFFSPSLSPISLSLLSIIYLDLDR